MGWQDRSYNRDDYGGPPRVQFRMPSITPLTLGLMVACLVLFIIQVATGGGARGVGPLEAYFSLTFQGNAGWWQPWRFITYQYLHGGVLHLGFNLLAMFFFLPEIERLWGRGRAFAFYTVGGIVSGLVFWLIAAVWQTGGYLIGASGSILAIMGAVALFFPDRQIVLLLFLVPIRVAVAILGALFALTALAEGDLSNAAHLGGLAFGFCGPWLVGPMFNTQRRRFQHWQQQRQATAELNEQKEIDRILAKVAEQGMQSLTGGEKRALARATANQKKRDAERAKRYSRS